MRLGILGPCHGDLVALAERARDLLDVVRADRVIYVGDDDGLDRVVSAWAHALVGSDPRADAMHDRAAARCALAQPADIDAFVEAERARVRLGVFTGLPAGRRTIELLDGRVVLLVYDKGTLDEDDIAAATVLVFGKHQGPLVKRVGTRVFVAPGEVGGEIGGSLVLDDGAGNEGIRIEVRNADGTAGALEHVGGARAAARMRVQGGS